MTLKNSSSLYYPKYYGNNCNNKKDVYDSADVVTNKSDRPCDNQDHCD